MDPKKKNNPANPHLEKREREFNVYVSGANAERVESLRKKEKHDISHSRSKSKNTRKPWDVGDRQDREPRRSENENSTSQEEVQPKRERRRWGDPQPISFDQLKEELPRAPKREIVEEMPEDDKEADSREYEESPDSREKRSREEMENEDIQNFITTMKSGDIEKLRQSLADSFRDDEMKKAAQNYAKKSERQDYEKKEPVPKKKIANEIDEEIVEDIDENPVDLDFEENRSQHKAESFYGGKPISIRKPRPISATYNEIGGHRLSEPVYGAIPSQSKHSESKRKLEHSGLEVQNNEFKESVPFQKISFANSSRNVESPSSAKIAQYKESKESQSKEQLSNFAGKVSQQEKVGMKSPTKLQPVEEERKSAKGQNPLLKRIEGLDETKKQLLENILDKIEKGELDKEILLNLEFLNIKKKQNAPEQDVRRSRDHNNKRDRKQMPTVKDLTLPSNVESKISKIAKKAEQDKSPQPKLKFDEEPLRRVEKEKEKVLPEIIPEKKKEPMKPNFPELSSKFPANNLQDSLEQISLPIKSHVNTNINNNNNEHNYYSNPEPVVFPDILKRKKPDPARESVNKTPELRISDAKLNFAQDHQLQFRIISTWGNISQAGLTELQIFNEKGEKIELKPADFHLRNCGLTSIKNISKITDGVIYTTEEEHMWLCTMPAPPTTPEISLMIQSEKNIGGIRIWNYNKSLIESIKGIKELEIIHNRNIVWTGIIDRGPGNEYEAYHTEIILQKGVVLPKVEPPVTLNLPYETGRNEQQNQQGENVPIWLKDTLPRNQPLPTSSFDQKSGQAGSLGRRESERNAMNPMRSGGDSSKSLIDKVHGQDSRLEMPNTKRQNVSAASSDINQTNDTSKASDSQNKSMTRIRNHPKTELPFKDILDDRSLSRNEERTPRAGEKEAQKENVQSSGKKDENASINSVEYFNITNFGRLRPAKRESLVQVFNLQQDVIEKVKDVQKRLDFLAAPIEEGKDILTQFDKGLKEDQPKLKLPQQSVEQASINIGKRKEVANKKATTTTGTSGQSKPPVDVFDSMFNKGSASAKNLQLDLPNQSKSVEAVLYENKSFKIPELPRGRFLKVCIYSTWGDGYYVGLNGIEIFDDKGELIVLQDVNSQIKANPPDINCLPGYGKDPRTVDKLVDGTYLTCDDLHVWLAPFTQGKEHTIDIDFRETKTISLIRVWNYNKSRIHSYRGARDVAIKLDESPIFLGEISKAPGSLKGAQDSCEYIMFTESDNILGRIERNDWLNKISKHDLVKPDLNATLERPMTGTKRFDENDLKQIKETLNPFLGPDGRPLTMAKMTPDNSIRDQIEKNKKELKRLEQQQKQRQEKEKANINKALSILTSSNSQSAEIKCKNIVIIISQSWGDPFYVGLTGLEVYDGEGEKIPINIKNLNAKPKDMNSIPGYSGDQRTLDKLINRQNITTKDENMWLIPFTPKQNHYIYITFDEAKIVSGIRFWNYNKSAENSFRGAKYINISADGVMLTPPNGILLKKAPGTDFYDYSQFVPLPFFDGWDEETVKLYKNIQPQPMQGFLLQEYDTPEFPTGFLFKIKLLSTWGDYDYIGLNGIEFYDHKGERLLAGNQKDYKLAVEPDSVSCLPNHDGDIRTPDKLVNGVNETYDDRNMWLAPYALERRDEGLFKTDNNEIIIIFDKPKILSCIKFWNYSKTQTRGVREVEVHCDDKVIYRGYLRMAPRENENQDKSSLQTSILFTKERDLIKKLDPYIYTEDGKLQKVVLNNEKKIINPASESRPQTHVTLERPTTSVKGAFPE